MNERHNRRPARLPQFDYGSPGAYFVTICTRDRACVLSEITVGEGRDGTAPPQEERCGDNVGEGLCALPTVTLTEIGHAVEESLAFICREYPGVSVEKHAVMPNHVHLLILLSPQEGGDGTPPLQQIVGRMKSYTTRLYGEKLWQRSYYDHVIRGREDYLEIWRYIDENPAKWAQDRFYRVPGHR